MSALSYPSCDKPIPRADQQRMRHIYTGKVGWTYSTVGGAVTVLFDNAVRPKLCVWSELEPALDIEIPPFPSNVVYPACWRQVEGSV